ncbi:MAG TPA: ATP-binding cassette domain-containing protein [Noviherbaspirillum sp.]|jgi:putative ABC transport system ATP-binding protein|uniref:ABC transporter ATP-binding protein n=1 Tax=Noviherbaspirillum sp. TaxID=1926288 RepID=UPI002DDD3A3F|nr:ATP-binding cassette domain-containing protein [Noviherbaspirillum sp.]HEV2611172.1 ATP-binding cassette domain-containing protein [Noviherbaspirillum sp.]
MLHISNLHYRYPGPAGAELTLPAFSLPAGEHAIVLGPSGCGKSTLLHLLSAILKPQAGSLNVAGTDIGGLTPRAADRWRGRHIGFLPQKLALVPSLSARENLLLAAYANGEPGDAARADALLGALGLADKAKAKPHQLSQGQQQRVAIGRALFNKPVLLLADEPTANLDDAACADVTALLIAQAAEAGASLVIATHDARVLAALPQATLLRLPVSARSGN